MDSLWDLSLLQCSSLAVHVHAPAFLLLQYITPTALLLQFYPFSTLLNAHACSSTPASLLLHGANTMGHK